MTERNSDQMFYLNTANPAPCTGNITSWRVCYYEPFFASTFLIRYSYWATYAVYRRVESGSNVQYQRVSETFSAKADNVIRGGFHCYTDRLDSSEQSLTIQAGDILGACVFNPIDPIDQTILRQKREQLNVVGEVRGESLLAMNARECSLTEMPLHIPVNQLTNVNSRRLHIYANVTMGKLTIMLSYM